MNQLLVASWVDGVATCIGLAQRPPVDLWSSGHSADLGVQRHRCAPASARACGHRRGVSRLMGLPRLRARPCAPVTAASAGHLSSWPGQYYGARASGRSGERRRLCRSCAVSRSTARTASCATLASGSPVVLVVFGERRRSNRCCTDAHSERLGPNRRTLSTGQSFSSRSTRSRGGAHAGRRSRYRLQQSEARLRAGRRTAAMSGPAGDGGTAGRRTGCGNWPCWG